MRPARAHGAAHSLVGLAGASLLCVALAHACTARNMSMGGIGLSCSRHSCRQHGAPTLGARPHVPRQLRPKTRPPRARPDEAARRRRDERPLEALVSWAEGARSRRDSLSKTDHPCPIDEGPALLARSASFGPLSWGPRGGAHHDLPDHSALCVALNRAAQRVAARLDRDEHPGGFATGAGGRRRVSGTLVIE